MMIMSCGEIGCVESCAKSVNESTAKLGRKSSVDRKTLEYT